MFGANAFGWPYPGQAYAGVAAGGTTYNKSIGGALAFAGATPLYGMQRGLTASFAPVGALARVLTLFRTLTAALTPTGSLARTLTLFRTVTASFTPVGALSRSSARRLTGALGSSGTLVRSTARRLAGSVTPTGAFTASVLFLRTFTASITPTGAVVPVKSSIFSLTLQAGLTFIGGANLYPDPDLYPGGDIYPYGGAILFQLNRTLSAILQPVGAVASSSARALTFPAVLHPIAAFVHTPARRLTAAVSFVGSLVGQKAAVTVLKSLFASLGAAGSLSSMVNPGMVEPGGGGWGAPMPDSHFTRYKPTLRRQRMKV